MDFSPRVLLFILFSRVLGFQGSPRKTRNSSLTSKYKRLALIARNLTVRRTGRTRRKVFRVVNRGILYAARRKITTREADERTNGAPKHRAISFRNRATRFAATVLNARFSFHARYWRSANNYITHRLPTAVAAFFFSADFMTRGIFLAPANGTVAEP